MIWMPPNPDSKERERYRRRVMESLRPRGHNRAYKTAEWKRIRQERLDAQPMCEFCEETKANVVIHANGNPWDNRWENLRSACRRCHSAKVMREKVTPRRWA